MASLGFPGKAGSEAGAHEPTIQMPRRFSIYFVYALLLLGVFGVAVTYPRLFQKLNTLRPVERIPDLVAGPGDFIDVDALIRPIPIQGDPVYNVHPETRHRQTILEGRGNCSQMVYGLAYQLERDGSDYQIIHLMTPTGFKEGDGHTIIRLPMAHAGTERTGLIDVTFGSILTGAEGPIDVVELEAAPIPDFGAIPLNAKAKFPWYQDKDDFLARSYVGYVPASEVRSYYAFLDRIYFSTGFDRPEKYLFDGLALIFGQLPEIFVPHFDALLVGRGPQTLLFCGVLWVMRSAFVLVPLLFLYELTARRQD